MHNYLACDLGAESGRLMLGTLEDGRLTLEEIHRFANIPRKHNASLHWDLASLWTGLLQGMRQAAQRRLRFDAISTDSWGVDYVLLGPEGALQEPVFHYRDSRCHQGVELAHARASWEQMFAETGLQFMPFNTVYQLMSEPPERLQAASGLLGIADAFNQWLSAVASTELSYASTTQLYNPASRGWSARLIGALGLPPHLFTPIVPCGSRLGPLRPAIREQTGLPHLEVIASCSHDTAAAVAAVPATARRWAYISSGTWSLMGVELETPILNSKCREFNFTNEIGYGHSVRLLKNIIGLWIVQECRRYWAANGEDLDYPALTALAAQARPFISLINPAHPRFVAPDDMPLRIAAYCQETRQPAPRSPGEVVRCALESLALFYRHILKQFAELVGHPFDALHIVGGGSKNALLNQFTANATGVPVIAGPAEATAAGNILVQALALGHVPSLQAARDILAHSTALEQFTPVDQPAWNSAANRFQQLLMRGTKDQ